MKEINNDTWYESPMVTADNLTIDFVQEHINNARELGATIFRTKTNKDVTPVLCGIVCYALKEDA